MAPAGSWCLSREGKDGGAKPPVSVAFLHVFRFSALSISGQWPRGTFCSGPSVRPFLSLVSPTQQEPHSSPAFPCPGGACPIWGPAPSLATPAADSPLAVQVPCPRSSPRHPCQEPLVRECQPASWGHWGQASLLSPWVRPGTSPSSPCSVSRLYLLFVFPEWKSPQTQLSLFCR